MSWMDSEGLAGGGRQCLGPFWRLGGISHSRGARARLADRHFTSCKGGGGDPGDGFLQGKKTRPRGREARHRSRAAAASREGGRLTQPALLR